MQTRLFVAAALLVGGLSAPAALGAAPAPTSTTTTTAPAPTSTTTTTTAPTVLKLKLDAVAELKDTRGRLELGYPTVKTAAKGKTEWREGVILLAAADAARAKGDAASYKRLATEANTRFDAAKVLAAGGTATTAGLTALKADLAVGKYVTPAETVVQPLDKIFTTSTTWAVNGFEPESF